MSGHDHTTFSQSGLTIKQRRSLRCTRLPFDFFRIVTDMRLRFSKPQRFVRLALKGSLRIELIRPLSRELNCFLGVLPCMLMKNGLVI
jgi:hypothetical protein